MLINVIREFNRAVPFQPYEVRTNSGERLCVRHPEFVLIAPRGSWVIITDEDERPRYISSLLIEEIAPLRQQPAPKRGRKSR